jgi:hypothetical protein
MVKVRYLGEDTVCGGFLRSWALAYKSVPVLSRWLCFPRQAESMMKHRGQNLLTYICCSCKCSFKSFNIRPGPGVSRNTCNPGDIELPLIFNSGKMVCPLLLATPFFAIGPMHHIRIFSILYGAGLYTIICKCQPIITQENVSCLISIYL